jgi:hypothetical protein
MDYRSDWPEIGLASSGAGGRVPDRSPPADDADTWARETRDEQLVVRWAAARNAFESELYDFPMWDLRVEASAAVDGLPRASFLALLEEHLIAHAGRLLDPAAWGSVYLYGKAVRGEPLHTALSGIGFLEVEQRRLYKTFVRDLAVPSPPAAGGPIRYAALSEIAAERHAHYRAQIIEVCREAFGHAGHSRHYTDPFLRERRPGLAYTLAVMQLNFDRLTPADFLVAVDPGPDTVCGFSVFEKKARLPGNLYTQLLSAVHAEYRGRGVYQGLTELLRRRLPPDASLLNVTHVDNVAMQRAYRQSGRLPLADTAVVRRVS